MKSRVLIKLFVLIAWVLVIFSLSFQSGDDTTKTSSSFTKTFVTITLKITNSYKSDEQVNEVVDKIHPVVRKVAHFTEFLILGFLTILLFNEFKFKSIYLYASIFCLIIACSDEILQLFIDGRASSIIDVLIDFMGSLAYILINKLVNKRK